MKFFDVQQGSSEWWDLRRGVLTASRTDKIITPKTLKPSAQQDDLIDELLSERFSLIPPENVQAYTSRAMEWGIKCEEEARRFYSLERNLDVTNGGFCLRDDGKLGSSPDFLVVDGKLRGCGEIKAPQGPTQCKYLRKGGLPDDFRSQVHTHLIVGGWDFCDFLSYSIGLPALLIRVVPDEYTEKLKAAIDEFLVRFDAALEKFAPSDPAEIIGLPGPVVAAPLCIEGPQVEEQAGEIPF